MQDVRDRWDERDAGLVCLVCGAEGEEGSISARFCRTVQRRRMAASSFVASVCGSAQISGTLTRLPTAHAADRFDLLHSRYERTDLLEGFIRRRQ